MKTCPIALLIENRHLQRERDTAWGAFILTLTETAILREQRDKAFLLCETALGLLDPDKVGTMELCDDLAKVKGLHN